MTAITIPVPGGPEALVPAERPVPQPKAGEVLVKVAAAGVNRPDVLQRQGGYPPPPGAPDIPGLEIAGEIVALGEGVDARHLGRTVMALVAGGGYAQYCCAALANTLPVPSGLSVAGGSAIPETFFTVWHNVFQRGGLKRGETFLVHGGTSGIGTTAIQLAKAFGATVIATAGSDDKCRACRDLGADHAINYKSQDFVAETAGITGGKGVNLILDMVGGSYVERNWEAAAFDGRIVQIAFLESPKITANFAKLMMKRLTHTGSTLRVRDIAFKAEIARQLEASVWPLIEKGIVRPVMDSTFPLEQASAAHARMEAGSHVGKIVLEVG
jgi:putative PIG3 family NAD(P)H quinone oxidoreductase